MKTYWINSSQLGLAFQTRNLGYQTMITHITQIKTNCYPLLNDGIEKKINLKKDKKTTQSPPDLTCKTRNLAHEPTITS